MFKHKRIPQSEWFRITAEEAIPKMQWLSNKTNQPIVIGNWKKAKDGHYYRRRKSRHDNWYTQQKSAVEINQEKAHQLELIIGNSEREKLRKSRKEPGYWPTKEDRSKIEWAEKDPTYNPIAGWMILVVASVILYIMFQQPTLLVIAGAAILFGMKK